MSKRPNSMLGRVRKGVYCININNQEVRHLQLKFSHECDIKKDEKTQTDFSLNFVLSNTENILRIFVCWIFICIFALIHRIIN